MSRDEIIKQFIAWSKKKENRKPSYDYLLKAEKLISWDDDYFGGKLFIINKDDVGSSIIEIEKLLKEAKKNKDWKEYSQSQSSRAPESILDKNNYVKFLKELKDSSRNYFSFYTNESSMEDLLKNKKGWFSGLYERKDKIKKGDIVFFAQKGPKQKPWPKGLIGICKIVDIKDDPTGKKTKHLKPYYWVKLESKLTFARPIEKEEFIGTGVKGVKHITKGNDANQANWLFPNTQMAKDLLGAVLNIFPETEDELKKIFGKDFIDFTNLPKGQAKSAHKKRDSKIPSDISPNKIEDEAYNLILYGAPGTGKSYALNKKREELFENERLYKRITFHPNYSYRNFVGSYKPKPIYKEAKEEIFGSDKITIHDHQKEPLIEYVFEAGPFLEMYVAAKRNPEYNFLIIIEELNRANPAAVFGDMFQLLDREENGESTYPISLESSAMDFLRSQEIDEQQIKLPSNLYLWATMNNADQGVMPMDSAFKRRWSFEYMPLNKNEKAREKVDIQLPWREIKWNKFREKINKKLINLNIKEDKLIGPFFLKENEMASEKAILNKLLLYIKEDVLKYDSGIFIEDLNTFSQIAEQWKKKKNVFHSSLGLDSEE